MTTDIINLIDKGSREQLIATLCGAIYAWGAGATLIEFYEDAEGIADYLLEDDTNTYEITPDDVDEEEWSTILRWLDLEDNEEDYTIYRASKFNQEAMYLAI